MINRLKAYWARFFFAETAMRPFLALRIGVSVILLVYACVLFPDWIRWFGDAGVLDNETLKRISNPKALSLLKLLPDTEPVLYTVFGIFTLQSVLLLFGILPRVQVISLFIWIVSLHNRNPLIWEGGDTLLRITLFLMIFMPLGKSKKSAEHPVWPLRLVQLQLSMLYFSTAGLKLRSLDWTQGNALYYASKLTEYSSRLLTFNLPPEFFWVYRVGTWLALIVEVFLIFGVWIPKIRRKAAMLGIAFHLIIEFSMSLFTFQWLMILILSTHLFEKRPDRHEPTVDS